MKRIILLTALIFSACQTQSTTPQSQTAELASSQKTPQIAPSAVSSEFLISTKGIGKAQLGMTLKEFKSRCDKNTVFEIVPSFMADIDAIAVSTKGIVQYYILYLTEKDSDPSLLLENEDRIITAIMTKNDNYQTEEGVKVGTTIRNAEEIYGDATLAYNTEGESREYITFNNHHPENIQFRASYFKLISDGLGFSGIYPEYPGVSYTTDKYRNDAAIAAIEVSCNPDNCLN